jgi:hypothetical protein
VQAEADMLSDTARLSPSADADEIAQSRAGIARKPAGCARIRSALLWDALSLANVQQLLAGYVSRTRVQPIIAARRGEHPGERDGGQADQQLMREPTESAIFRYRLPRRREPVSAAPASWSGLGHM